MSIEDELGALVTRLTDPTRTEIVRAKKLMLEALSTGGLQQTDHLLRLLATSDGIEFLEEARRNFVLSGSPLDTSSVNLDNPVIRHLRAEAASLEALAELDASGLIVAVGSNPVPRNTKPRLGYQHSGGGSGFAYESPRPRPVSDVVRLVHRARGDLSSRLDPDLFVADLAGLQLDPRTVRCIRESLDAYRRELFLACASLLGAASEGAWYAAGEKLRHLDTEVDARVQRDGAAALQGAVTALFEARLPPTMRWEHTYLATQAELLRELRNYGVHPRASASTDLESILNEEACGLLVLTTHRYLARLSAATCALL